MKYIITIVVAAFATYLLIFTLNSIKMLEHRTVVINCQLAEISPDFTPEMRKQCREARSK